MTRTLARPYPLGATLGNTGCNFSIYSPDCKSLSLALFDENDEFTTYKLENEYADIRYVFIDGIKKIAPKYIIFVHIYTSWLFQNNKNIILSWIRKYTNNYYELAGIVNISKTKTTYNWKPKNKRLSPKSKNWIAIFERIDLLGNNTL